MKTFVISLIIWLFIVPCAVASFLILTFLAAFVPNLYFVLTCIAVALATLATIWGPFCLLQSSDDRSAISSDSRQHSISFQEKNNERYLESSFRF